MLLRLNLLLQLVNFEGLQFRGGCNFFLFIFLAVVYLIFLLKYSAYDGLERKVVANS